MDSVCSIALKEWAVVCAALAEGRQLLLLRTGGIAEGPQGFRVEHPAFWLFPTRFHQSTDELVPDAVPLLEAAAGAEPPAGVLRLSLYATVEAIHRISDPSRLARLDGLHILSPDTLRARFDYRSPGLFVLVVRVYQLSQPIEVTDEPRYAGCHSWVELDEPLPTTGLQPVLNDDEFGQRMQQIESSLPSHGNS